MNNNISNYLAIICNWYNFNNNKFFKIKEFVHVNVDGFVQEKQETNNSRDIIQNTFQKQKGAFQFSQNR